MPTLPSEPTSPQVPEPRNPSPHSLRDVAGSFGANAERYDRARPRYPREIIERIAASAPGPQVLDVGIGTGIAAEQLREAGCTVTGVDVDARMAEIARRRGFEVDVARFEDWEGGGRRFDAVVAAQTWHWIDPVAGAARAARVLRPTGPLVLFWNVFQVPPELARSFAEVYRDVVPQVPTAFDRPALAAYTAMTDAATAGIRAAGSFAEPVHSGVEWDHTYTRQDWLDQVPTHGGANRLPPELLDRLLQGVGEAIDEVGGSFVMHYTTVALTAVRSQD